MITQKNTGGADKSSIVLRSDKTGGSFIAIAPVLFVFLGVTSFQETFAEWFDLFGSFQLAMTLWIVLIVVISQIRQNPRRYFKRASDVRYFLILGSGLVLIALAAQKNLLEAGLSMISAIGIGWIEWLIGFTVYMAQVLIFAEAIRVGISWRPGPIMSWAPSVGGSADNSSIATSDNVVRDVPTVEQLRDKLSSLEGSPKKL